MCILAKTLREALAGVRDANRFWLSGRRDETLADLFRTNLNEGMVSEGNRRAHAATSPRFARCASRSLTRQPSRRSLNCNCRGSLPAQCLTTECRDCRRRTVRRLVSRSEFDFHPGFGECFTNACRHFSPSDPWMHLCCPPCSPAQLQDRAVKVLKNAVGSFPVIRRIPRNKIQRAMSFVIRAAIASRAFVLCVNSCSICAASAGKLARAFLKACIVTFTSFEQFASDLATELRRPSVFSAHDSGSVARHASSSANSTILRCAMFANVLPSK